MLSVTAIADSDGGHVVVKVVGDVDTYTAPLLALCLHSQAGQPALRKLVVDLQRVTFFGAAGVSVLAEANERCRRRGARLVVRSGGQSTVLASLRHTGLAETIALDQTEARRARTTGPAASRRVRPAHWPGSGPTNRDGRGARGAGAAGAGRTPPRPGPVPRRW
jgi:anti-anti-sigma factor